MGEEKRHATVRGMLRGAFAESGGLVWFFTGWLIGKLIPGSSAGCGPVRGSQDLQNS